jgi:hypothetical protein
MAVVSEFFHNIKVIYHDSTMEQPMSRPRRYVFRKVTSSKYIPEAGDVVEFEYHGDSEKGLVFIHTADNGKPLSIGSACSAGEVISVDNIRKIGHTSVDGVNNYYKGRTCFDKYFKNLTEQPTFTGIYEERQKQWIKHHGLKVGDKVKITNKFSNKEGGCDIYSTIKKDEIVGSEFQITRFDDRSIQLRTGAVGATWFPYFALEPVK